MSTGQGWVGRGGAGRRPARVSERSSAGTRKEQRSSVAAVRASPACGPSALLTAITSASSSTPFLMPCKLVAGAGQREQQEGVHHAGHGGLGLADADRLDDDTTS